MGNNFYQTNNKILALDPGDTKNIDYIRFNHYISRKENLQRTKEELDRGLFKFSYISAMNDLNMSRRKLQRLVKWFEDNAIIECIEKSNTKNKSSVYAYTSVYYDSKSDINCDTNCDINKYSNFNGFNSMSDINSDTNCDTSKKEKKKENIKNVVQASSSSDFAYTKKSIVGKKKVQGEYHGYEVKATRFDVLSHHYRNKDNKYVEANGFVYEISKSEVDRVNAIIANRQCMNFHNDFAPTNPIEFREISNKQCMNFHNDFRS